MKRIIIILLMFLTTGLTTEMPFKRGVNLTNWYQAPSPQRIQFSKFTRQDFVNLKNLGCDVIRLPINMHFMTNGAPNYIFDPLFYYFLDQTIDMAEELELHLILDDHTFDPAIDTSPNVKNVLIPVWTQLASRYKNRSNYLYYEILNEPHGISDSLWNQIQRDVIQAIRQVDQKHTIIVGPAGWNSYNHLDDIFEFRDDNLIYTFHYYDPFLFTHQGTNWTDPSMASLSGVPFPYDAQRMPELPPDLSGTWVENSYNNYARDGTIDRMVELLSIAANFKIQREVPVFCGEFGVYMLNSNNEDRTKWYYIVRTFLEENDITWAIWDYTGGFGLFESGSNEMFDYDLNIPLIQALGLNVPPQAEYVFLPDSAGFDIYLDYIGPRIIEQSWTNSGLLNLYSSSNPVLGRFCIYWTAVDQYNNIGFAFRPIKDLSLLVDKGFAIDFWLRGDSPNVKFDIRFVDTKTENPDDHPWRMRYTIDETVAAGDGSWKHLQIPLNQFTEHGAWDNGWFEPRGDFDWAAINRFEIVAEHQDLKGIQFWFDNIRIVDPQLVNVPVENRTNLTYELYQNFPNPFNSGTTIRYTVPATNFIEIAIYNIVGQKIRLLLDRQISAGSLFISWDGKDDFGAAVGSGVYLYRISAGSFIEVKKMLLMR